MAPTVWYAIAAQEPPIGVVVLLIWDGRGPIEASLVKHPRSGQYRWLTHDRGRPVFLPTDATPPDPKRPWAGWHTLKTDWPDYWRPLKPDAWQLPLPEPAYIESGDEVSVRMWSATQRFQAVEDAEAAELAREMERDREAARAQDLDPEDAEPPDAQWWLDPHAVTYSLPGRITLREAEGRLMRAFMTERWIRVERPAAKTFAGVLANLARSMPLPPGELAAQDPMPIRVEPTGRDWDDVLIALSWLKALEFGGRAFRGGSQVLRLRAAEPALSWRQMAPILSRSHEATRGLYGRSIAEVTRTANGQSTRGGERAEVAMAAMRDANRRARAMR